MATRSGRSPNIRGTSSRMPCPTTTSYGEAPPTCIRVSSRLSGMVTILHQREDPVSNLARRQPVGRHRVPGDGGVDRGAFVEQLLDPAPDVAEQQRPGDSQA